MKGSYRAFAKPTTPHEVQTKRRGLIEFGIIYLGLSAALIAIGKASDGGAACAAATTGMIFGKLTIILVLTGAILFLNYELRKLSMNQPVDSGHPAPDYYRASWLLWRARWAGMAFAGISYSWDLLVDDHLIDGTCDLGARMALAALTLGLLALLATYPIQALRRSNRNRQ